MAKSTKKGIKLADFNVYIDGSTEAATGDVELPSFEAISEEYSGAGVLGSIDVATAGAFGPMSVTFNYSTINEHVAGTVSGSHDYDLRGSQIINNGTVITEESVKVTMRTIAKNTSLGTFTRNAGTGTTVEAEVVYIKIDINGRNWIELDKLNYIFKVNGVDQLAQRRSNLGK